MSLGIARAIPLVEISGSGGWLLQLCNSSCRKSTKSKEAGLKGK